MGLFLPIFDQKDSKKDEEVDALLLWLRTNILRAREGLSCDRRDLLLNLNPLYTKGNEGKRRSVLLKGGKGGWKEEK